MGRFSYDLAMAEHNSTARSPMGCLGAAHGLLTACTAVAGMLAAFIVFGMLREVARKGDVELPALAAWLIEHPIAVAASAAPALVVGVYAMLTRRSQFWLIALESALLLLPIGVIFYGFIAVLMPLYQLETI